MKMITRVKRLRVVNCLAMLLNIAFAGYRVKVILENRQGVDNYLADAVMGKEKTSPYK